LPWKNYLLAPLASDMAIVLLSVCAIDAAVAFLVAKPARWCAVIPALIPVLTPLVLLPPRNKHEA
jgi:hypothetical protein